MQVQPSGSSPLDRAQQAPAYDFSKVPAEDLERVKSLVKVFGNWHDAKVVTDDDVKAARTTMGEMSLRVTPGEGMLYYRLDEITKLLPHAGGPGVIAPDGTVRGQIVDGRRPLDVTFNILANPIVIDLYRAPGQKPLSTLEKLQALAKENPEFGATVASPEALIAAVKKAAAEGDAIGVSFLFVPGSFTKVVGRDIDNSTALALSGVTGFANVELGELLSEHDQGGVTVRSYAARNGDWTGTQEFERHGDIWLMLP